jgi:predicted RNA-binding Zn-ribbon protein involved in translation (DUF1610 family)
MNDTETKTLFERERNFGEEYLKKFNIKDPNCSVSIPVGWYDLVCDLTMKLIDLGWDKDIHQIKEKFGGLRFYVSYVNITEEMKKTIAAAEQASYAICPVCGELKVKRDLHETCSKRNFW